MEFFGWGKKQTLDSLTSVMPRDELVRRSRILVIDDERPDLIDDLKASHFAVDYVPDVRPEHLASQFDGGPYDLVLLDFGQVGQSIGKEQGLSILRHMKRVNPAVVVLAYTSKALGTEHAEFYRLADGVLPKDAGIADSMRRIEEALQTAHSVDNLWRAVLSMSGVRRGSDTDKEWQDLLVRGVKDQGKLAKFKADLVSKLGPELGERIAVGLVTKLVEIGLRSLAG
jgi:DNA-binding NarL/FixJ family response regulator